MLVVVIGIVSSLRRNQATRVLLALAAVLSAVLLVACDDAEELRIENQSSDTVVVLREGTELTRIAPGESDDFGVLPFDGTRLYEVKDLEGTLLQRSEFTWDEISEEDGITLIVR
jgi:hypothetical protein